MEVLRNCIPYPASFERRRPLSGQGSENIEEHRENRLQSFLARRFRSPNFTFFQKDRLFQQPQEHWPELPQLGRRSADRCDVFPVALGVEAIYLNRRGSMKLMLCAAIGAAHWIDGGSYRPGPSKQQLCSARAIHHFLLRSWHQVGLRSERMVPHYARSQEYAPGFCRCHYGVFA